MSAVKELTRICAVLPAHKVEELVDFARFLEARLAGESARVEESAADAAWEKIIADPKPHPKLDADRAAISGGRHPRGRHRQLGLAYLAAAPPLRFPRHAERPRR